MKLKKLLIVFGSALTLSVLILTGLLGWLLYKLPGTYQIREALTPQVAKKIHTTGKALPPPALKSETSSHALPEKTAPTEPAPSPTPERLDRVGMALILNDFTNERVPLMSSCKNLQQASQSGFLKDSKNASAKYFVESLSQDQKDPLVESAVPVIRYVFRAPGIGDAFALLSESELPTEDLVQKAEFYTHLLRAGSFIREHRADIDAILQRSYNMHVLTKAVAQRPELARDPATLSFCEQIEKATNFGIADFNPEEESKEISRFLADAGISPLSVGFDPKYRSQVKLNISSTGVRLDNTWLTQLFARDIEKATARR